MRDLNSPTYWAIYRNDEKRREIKRASWLYEDQEEDREALLRPAPEKKEKNTKFRKAKGKKPVAALQGVYYI